MAARKKVTKSRATKKPTRKSVAPKRAPAKVKAKARVAKKKSPIALKPATRKAGAKAKTKSAKAKTKSAKATSKTKSAKATSKTNGAKANGAKTNGVTSGAPISRRDPTGHLNPKYAADLRARSRASAEDIGTDNAFLRKARAHDPLAEELGEEAVLTMTSGEDQSNRLQDMEVEEESGGPFITTTAREEFARGTDESNPADGLREPFPTT